MANANKKKALVAGGLAAAILAAGGGTFALWSATADVDGGTVTAGNLDITALSTVATDVSPDRGDAGHVIEDLSTWRAVPGDVIEVGYAVDLALEGDNLVANLDAADVEAVLGEGASEYVTVTTEVRDAAGAVITPGADGLYRFQAPRDGQAAGEDISGGIEVPVALDGTADVTAVAVITFSADTPDQVLTQTDLATLAEQGVTFTQVREGAGF